MGSFVNPESNENFRLVVAPRREDSRCRWKSDNFEIALAPGTRDFNYLSPISLTVQNMGSYCNHTDPGPAGRGVLSQTPIVMPVSTDGDSFEGSVVQTDAGGIGLYINGERFIFALTGGALPADGTEWTFRTSPSPAAKRR